MVHKVHLCHQSVFSDACVAVSRAMTVKCPALARYGPQSTSLSSVSVFTDACVCVSRAMTVRCPVQASTVHKVHLCPRSQCSVMRVFVCPGL